MTTTEDRALLRRRAEDRLAGRPGAPGDVPADEPGRVLHELRVHQAELEMQYEELRRAWDEAEESRRQLEALYEEAPVGYLTLDERTTVHRANLTVADMLGLSRSRIVGRPFAAFCVDGTQDALHRHLVELRERGQATAVDVAVRSSGRTLRWLRVVGRPAPRDTARVALVDVTEERRLREAFDRAARVEAIGRLAAGVAHDFNNLLMGIIGCADRALEELGPQGPARPWVEALRVAARDGSDVAAQLVGLGKAGSGEGAPVDLNGVVRRYERLLGRIVGEDVRVETALAEGDVIAQCTPGSVEQLLLNLVANARDAMPRGGTLRIETARGVEAAARRPGLGRGPFVCLTVSDTGTGMDADTAERLFEPYFTTKQRPGGGGLGLSTAYAAVRRCGGDIEVRTAPGEGATFRVWLPEGRASARPPRMSSRPPPPKGAPLILVVEDDELVRMAARHYLEKGGYRVAEAASVAEAEALAAREAPRAILTDVVLPDGGGDELAGRIHAARADLPVVFVSAYPRDVLLADGRIAEADRAVAKPFEAGDLLEALAEVIGEE